MERDLTERALPHLDGYAGSRPVRTATPRTVSARPPLGYLLEGALAYTALGGKLSSEATRAYARVADSLRRAAGARSRYLGNSRGGRGISSTPRRCAGCRRRAIRLVGERPGWIALRERIWREIMARGRSPEGHFVQSFAPDPPCMDASLLQLAMIGAPVDRETLERTRAAVERELRHGDFVHRYRSEDGLAGSDGAFLVCSFWLVDALLSEGRGGDARSLFERLEHANDVGLFPRSWTRRPARSRTFPRSLRTRLARAR